MRHATIIFSATLLLAASCSTDSTAPSIERQAPQPTVTPAAPAPAPIAVMPVRQDRTVEIESPGRNDKGTWLARPTLTLEGLDGFVRQGRPQTGRFGGWLARREPATGYFYAKQVDGRWWLVDPEGYLFFSQGLNVITASRSEITDVFGGEDKWLAATGDLLRQASFNTAGGWSSPLFQRGGGGLARTVTMHVMESFGKSIGVIENKEGMNHFIRDCIPVFHPGFKAFAESSVAGMPDAADDPWIIGLFSDNELPLPVDVLDRCLKLDRENPALRPNLEAAEAWVAANVPDGDPAKITADHRQRFVAHVAEQYFAVMRDTIKKRFPNHMYIGSRLLALIGHIGKNEYFWRMVGRYQDVISMNYYDVWGPDRDSIVKWEGWSSRPMLITEWYAKAQDVPGLSNKGGAGFLVRTQEDRAKYYQHFVITSIATKRIVGWHWFKYQDDHSASKREDNVGGANKGFVDVDFKPFPALFARAGDVQAEAYTLATFFDAR